MDQPVSVATVKPWIAGEEPPFVRIQKVTKKFGDFIAVDDVSLDVWKGELFCLLGGSGCGKSTLLRMLAGFETPSFGRIEIDGQDMAGLPPYERPTNMMFQSYALFPHMTVEKNVAYGLLRDGMRRDEATAKVAEMLKLVQLSQFAHRKPHQLSGGQRQRVALARSLVKRPKLLLLDEPLGALDKKLREETQFELINIQEKLGVTFIVVTHDQEEAMTLATRIGVMQAGDIVQVGEPAEIYEYPSSRFVADFVGSVNMFEGRVVEDEPEHIALAVADLDGGDAEGAIYVGHGVSCTLDQTLWYAVRPEKLRLTRRAAAGAQRLPGLRRRRRLHGQPVGLPAAAGVGPAAARDQGEPRALRRRRHHLARGRLGFLARHRRSGAVAMTGLLRRLGFRGRALVIAVPFLWLLVFFLIPFLVVAKISLSEPAIAMPPYVPLVEWDELRAILTLNFGNFAFLFDDPLYLNAYLSSLRIAFVSAVLALVLGYPMAYYIARSQEPWRSLLLMLVILPFWTSFLLRVYAWQGFLRSNGVINNFLLWTGVIDEPLVMLQTDFAVYLGIVYTYLPFMILPLYANLVKLEESLLEASSDLGGRPLSTFFHVTLPLSMPGVIAGFMLVFVPAIGEFVIPELLGGPDTLMIGRVLWNEFFSNRDWPVASAVAIAMLVVLVVPIMLLRSAQARVEEE